MTVFLSIPKLRSHPVRVRGLKHKALYFDSEQIDVAPRAGAWIETQLYRMAKRGHLSHPVRVRGLKHILVYGVVAVVRRTPCGCVD